MKKEIKNEIKKAALYVRVSTHEQAKEGYSIQEQTERLKKYCQAMNWKIENVYTDAGFTGSNKDRPALKNMIKAVENNLVNVVVVYKLDRLSRSQLDTLDLLENVFLKNGCDFVSISENFDTGSPFGRAMIGILAVFAQLEREQIRERMQVGKEARAKNGLPTCSAVIPIGYEKENGRLIVNEYEAMHVRMIYDSFLRGVPIKKIVRDLSAAGYSHKHGAWHQKTVHNVLRSQLYIGKVKHGPTWYDGKHEPIINAAQFNAAQNIFTSRRDRFQNAGKASAYLSGLLYCECGAKYYRAGGKRKKNGQRTYYYTCQRRRQGNGCRNKIYRADELEELIFNEVRKLATEPIEPEPVEDPTDEIKKEIENAESRINKLIDLYAVNGLPLDALAEKIKEENARKEKLENQLKNIVEKIKPSDVLENASGFSAVLDNGSFEDIRGLLESLIEKIVIDNDSIKIYWRFR